MTEEEGAPLDIKFQQRFSKNLATNGIFFILNIIVGLALVPFFLNTLGDSAYGLIPLATSITGYVTLMLTSVNASVSRFLTIDLQKGLNKQANETFNTSLFGTLGIILLLIPVELLISWFSISFFDIGTESPIAVFVMFALIFGSVLIQAWGSNFQVILFAYNRLDIRNNLNSFQLFLQIILIIGLFLVLKPSLILVGVAYFVSAVITLFATFIASRKVSNTLIISISHFAKHRFREILGMAFWSVLFNIGTLLYLQSGILVVNFFFGDIAGAHYSFVMTWNTLIIGVTALITSVFTPMIYSYRSKEDPEGLARFTSFTTRITTLIMILPISLLCVFAPQLLTYWIGEQYAFLSPLVWIILIPLILRVQAFCTGSINAAYLRIRLVAIIALLVGCLNIMLAIIIPKLFNNGMYGVAWAWFISISIMALFQAFYNAYIIKAPRMIFVKPMFFGMVVFTVLSGFGILLNIFLPINSLIRLILAIICISIVYGIILLKFILKADEKRLIRSCIPSILEKHLPSWLL